ncbi:two component system response regulator [Kitasatospora cheerisanensis KCTC 2395]|uniref:Two component system response regulator n=1 Tax=Kitasatospora cheerisanensis KCTC 2395 TaxID=1348663 RepID=A0A066YQF4_9ACTN|nr:response regulator transcription factor [Kitasatospora cheerisanensis]KDN82184.1 two component system response regulator [Kitasatospora cheerisanensis KCTC 2395]
MTTVLIVDDQVLIRAGLAALVRAAPGLEVAGEAATGEEAVELAARHRPDVVLMDIRLPGISGIAALERILADAAEPRPKVVMLTVFDLDSYVFAALKAGASGFLLKDTPPERLLAAVELIAAGEMLFAPSVTRRLVETFAARADPDRHRTTGLEALTDRETDVLHLVGQGLTNEEVAGRLVVTVATVKTHLNRVMSKLGLASRAQAVVVAYESGLVTPGSRDRTG